MYKNQSPELIKCCETEDKMSNKNKRRGIPNVSFMNHLIGASAQKKRNNMTALAQLAQSLSDPGHP